MRALVVEDEPTLREQLVSTLREQGFAIDQAEDGEEGLYLAQNMPVDLAIVDLGLPGRDGLSLIQNVRKKKLQYPILILTARDTWQDKVDGLEAGADDYVVKPFDVREVVLRAQALSRRIRERKDAQGGGDTGTELTWKTLRIDPRSHDAYVGDKPLSLRPLEFKLLVTLMSDPGRVFSRKELLVQVWDMPNGGNPRTVDVHVRRLRQNLGASSEVVETVPGFGYRAKVK